MVHNTSVHGMNPTTASSPTFTPIGEKEEERIIKKKRIVKEERKRCLKRK